MHHAKDNHAPTNPRTRHRQNRFPLTMDNIKHPTPATVTATSPLSLYSGAKTVNVEQNMATMMMARLAASSTWREMEGKVGGRSSETPGTDLCLMLVSPDFPFLSPNPDQVRWNLKSEKWLAESLRPIGMARLGK